MQSGTESRFPEGLGQDKWAVQQGSTRLSVPECICRNRAEIAAVITKTTDGRKPRHDLADGPK